MSAPTVNLALNPSLEIDTANVYTPGSAPKTLTRVAEGVAGVMCGRVSVIGAGSAGIGWNPPIISATNTRVQWSVQLRCNTAATATPYWEGTVASTGAYAAGFGGSAVALAPGVWTLVTGDMTVGADRTVTGLAVLLDGGNAVAAGLELDGDACMIVTGDTLPDYFDGDTSDSFPDYYTWAGAPHASVSTHTVSTGVRLDKTVVSIAGAEATCWVDHVTIRHGREDYGEQSEADTITVELSPDHTGAAVPAIEIGADLLVTHQVTDLGPIFTRFRGRVSDVSRTWDEAGEATPDQGLCQVVAVSSLGELGRRLVGDEPWPQELDGARALRILRLAYPTLPATNVDPGIYQLIPRDVDRQDALGLVHEAAEAGGGLLWTKAGDPFPHYADFEHRRGTVAALEIDACDILAAPTWSRDLSGLCNYISLTYGVAPAEGEAPSLTSRNQASVDKFGEYGLSVTLALASQADAQARANLLTTRSGAPQWVLSELPLAMSELDPATTETLLGLDTHSLMLLTGLPAAGSAPTSIYAWVEGWSEEFAAGTHELTMAVSSYCATAPPVRWNDVPPEATWDTADPSWSWDSVICIGPTPNRGRWDDVPATTRWDTIDASITWDTWKG